MALATYLTIFLPLLKTARRQKNSKPQNSFSRTIISIDDKRNPLWALFVIPLPALPKDSVH